MSRFKRILAAAAALGGTLAVALLTANQADPEPMTCREFGALVRRLEGERLTYFVAVRHGYAPPEMAASRPLGECASRRCTIGAQGCRHIYSYRYEPGPLVNGWRLVKLVSHPYVAGGWRELAQGNPDLHFMRSYGEAVSLCVARFGAASCRGLLRSVNDCWERSGGEQCRGGLRYGPGAGGVQPNPAPLTTPPAPDACTVGADDAWVPCEDDGRGRGYYDGDARAAMPSELDL